MGHIITPEFIDIFRFYPSSSQENIVDPLVVAKLSDCFTSTSWFLIEYNAKHKVALGYIVGSMQDEMGFISIEELEKPVYTFCNITIPGIDRDITFSQKPLSEALKHHRKQYS